MNKAHYIHDAGVCQWQIVGREQEPGRVTGCLASPKGPRLVHPLPAPPLERLNAPATCLFVWLADAHGRSEWRVPRVSTAPV